MRPSRSILVLVVPVLVLAACASHQDAESAAAPEERRAIVDVPVLGAPTRAAAGDDWEPWPPAFAVNEPRPAPSGPIVELACPPGGMKVTDLLRVLSERTGAVVLFDETTNAKMRSAVVTWAGDWKVATSRLPDACRAALFPLGYVLTPTGLGADGTPGYVLYDQNHPSMRQHAVALRESQVLAHEDCDGLYVATTFRIRDIVDTSRLRQMLMTHSTQVASLGRVTDGPGTRTLAVVDFAPVVAAMKRIVDEANRNAVPPAPTAAPARTK